MTYTHHFFGASASLFKMAKRLLPIALCITVAGCNSPAPKLAHVKPLTVNHTVVFNTNTSYLRSSEIESLRHFVSAVPASAVSYAGISSDDADRHNAVRSKLMKNYLIHHGIDGKVIHVVPSFTKMDRQSMLITLQYSQGVPPGACPDWSKNALANYNNTDMSNFGCAYNNNLAVQVADPSDLDHGHGDSEFDGPRDSVVIQKYMLDTPQPAGTAVSASAPSSSSSGSTSSP